jgi:hypothetical protein
MQYSVGSSRQLGRLPAARDNIWVICYRYGSKVIPRMRLKTPSKKQHTWNQQDHSHREIIALRLEYFQPFLTSSGKDLCIQ